MYNPPRLQTPRLNLRPFQLEDATALFDYASDPEFSQYLNYDPPRCPEDAIAFLQLVLAGEMGTNLWALTLTNSPTVISAVQFNLESPTLESPTLASLHYEIARPLWNQGLASEAIATVLTWAKTTHPQIPEIHADTHLENTASRKLLEKFHFHLTTTQDHTAFYIHRAIAPTSPPPHP
ncbi:MAG: GNAT family N-acetyltransferase [Oculatellaceae cyanobacterium Prado106]|nr:GNAT family N-acetyltransferase [Oculatellaceae cyanobacterium Prado106]